MVDPVEPCDPTPNGPLYLTASHLLNHCTGSNQPCALGFGFAHDDPLKQNAHLGILVPVGEMLELVWPARRSDAYIGHHIDVANPQHRAQLEQLFTQMRAALSPYMLGERGVNYIQQRYLEHPLYQYQVKLVSRANAPRTVLGMVVLRVVDEQVLIMDLVGEPQYFTNLIEYAQTQNTSLGAHQLSMWISADHLPLLGNGYTRVEDSSVRTPTILNLPSPDTSALVGRWFLTTGDTDFK